MAELSPIHTGDYNLVAENGDCRQKRRLPPKRRLSPKTATVAEFGDKLSPPNSATIVASVDRALQVSKFD